MSNLCTKEINAQVVISLLKSHGIRKIVASPGTTNVAFIGSIQNDPFFTIYSSVDERSSAYLACGLAEESGEPVVISCTGATASRNYVPGLTEAYYRKLPVLAITSMQSTAKVGHLVAQTIDRTSIQNDIAKLSVELPIVKDSEDLWDCEIKVNKAILELKRNGGGPAHINLPTTYTLPFEPRKNHSYRVIERVSCGDEYPEIKKGRVAVFIGAHKKWTENETSALDQFCQANNAVVFCDHSSGYNGEYRILSSIVASQDLMDKRKLKPELTIHIGEVTGDYSSLCLVAGEVWRVSEDGEIRDTFRRLRYVFEMKESEFFKHYTQTQNANCEYFSQWESEVNSVRSQTPDLPFSNIWLASEMSKRLPENSVLHLGILNSLRSWNFFEVPESVTTSSNVGGFGIDGGLSTIIGASLVDKEKLFFSVIGDLAFFYDMNVLGNRHVGNNIRILLVNNGKGTEFRQYNHHASYFGEDAESFIAAAGHFGNKSQDLVKNYAQSLGFDYYSASNKNEFYNVREKFLAPKVSTRPIILEVFTDSKVESQALELMKSIIKQKNFAIKNKAKNIIGSEKIRKLKKILRT